MLLHLVHFIQFEDTPSVSRRTNNVDDNIITSHVWTLNFPAIIRRFYFSFLVLGIPSFRVFKKNENQIVQVLSCHETQLSVDKYFSTFDSSIYLRVEAKNGKGKVSEGAKSVQVMKTEFQWSKEDDLIKLLLITHCNVDCENVQKNFMIAQYGKTGRWCWRQQQSKALKKREQN